MTPSQRNPESRPVGALLAPDILALLEESPELIGADTEELHPADLADVAEAMPFEKIPLFLAALPTDRAASVLEYLVSRKVARERLRSTGLGSNRSVADNKSAEGRANNRRVEIVIEAPPVAQAN